VTETWPPEYSGESGSAVGNSTESNTPSRPTPEVGARGTVRCVEGLLAESRCSAYSRLSLSSTTPADLIDPPGARTFPAGRAVRDATPATAPDARGRTDCESLCGEDAVPDDPGAASSAAATTGQAAIANPSPSAKAAEPTRTPNATAFMTPPTVANQLRCPEYPPVAVAA